MKSRLVMGAPLRAVRRSVLVCRQGPGRQGRELDSRLRFPGSTDEEAP